MDADGLPLVGPGLDYTKIEAINQKRIIAFVNHFLSHTVQFLNHFSVVCEQKLSDINVKIQRLEATASILETKLSYIPGLENVTAPTSSQPAAAPAVTPQDTQSSNQPPPPPSASMAPPPASTAPPTESAEQPVEETPPELIVKNDPHYSKFFKLLQVGVPPPAVKQKMAIEGLIPDLLDTPNAPAPPANENKPGSNSDQDSSEKSDSDSEEDW